RHRRRKEFREADRGHGRSDQNLRCHRRLISNPGFHSYRAGQQRTNSDVRDQVFYGRFQSRCSRENDGEPRRSRSNRHRRSISVYSDRVLRSNYTQSAGQWRQDVDDRGRQRHDDRGRQRGQGDRWRRSVVDRGRQWDDDRGRRLEYHHRSYDVRYQHELKEVEFSGYGSRKELYVKDDTVKLGTDLK
ncbi:hypothetical protein A2U01_0039285, partial [Trifolium medium]|nr:hypothetical protein [Trifolium medium]